MTECVVLTHLGPNRQTGVEGALFPVISREGIGQVVSPLDVGHPQVADHHSHSQSSAARLQCDAAWARLNHCTRLSGSRMCETRHREMIQVLKRRRLIMIIFIST